jgi:hypothetical protein
MYLLWSVVFSFKILLFGCDVLTMEGNLSLVAPFFPILS